MGLGESVKDQGLLPHKAIYSNKQDRFGILPSSESTELVIKILARLLLGVSVREQRVLCFYNFKRDRRNSGWMSLHLSFIEFRKGQEAGQRQRHTVKGTEIHFSEPE